MSINKIKDLFKDAQLEAIAFSFTLGSEVVRSPLKTGFAYTHDATSRTPEQTLGT